MIYFPVQKNNPIEISWVFLYLYLSIPTLKLWEHFMDYTVKKVDVEMKSSIKILLYHNDNVVTFCNP